MNTITPADLLKRTSIAFAPGTVGPFEVVISGDPVPKGRPRSVMIGGFARILTPKATRQAEAAIKHALMVAKAPRYSGTRLVVALAFRVSHGRRVDADNLAKLVLDACNGFLWDDDYQIRELRVTVDRYHAEASTYLRVEALGPLWTKPKKIRTKKA